LDRLVLGTRGSALALWQARYVAARLQTVHPGLEVEVRIIRTEGDRVQDRPFGDMPGKGFFVKEIEDALLAGDIDLAVHSLKDVPTEQPAGLAIVCVPERHDPRDALLSEAGWTIEELPEGTLVATGSPRRRCQLLHRRPDLRMTQVRGNVDTRVRKLKEGQFGAMVLAVAGVERLGVTAVAARAIPIEISLPAVGQGALGIEARTDDAATRRLAGALQNDPVLRSVSAERAFLHRLGGGCLAPATAHARLEADRIRIDALVGDADGRRLLRDRIEGPSRDAEALGQAVAARLLEAGGEAILKDARSAAGGA
jgi:hydroxymethylbilane synthase